MGRNPWTSFNPCLPLKSRGHLLLAVIPLLLFCCYRFYHYKFYFTFISNKTEGGGEDRLLGGNEEMREEKSMEHSGNPAVVESQAHSASALQKRKKKQFGAFS